MKIRIALSVTAALVALLVAGGAGADGNELNGHDWLRAKNTSERTVLLGHQVYHLGPQTPIQGLHGENLTLGELIWIPELESYAKEPRMPGIWVKYDATRVGDRLILNWIELTVSQEGLDIHQLSERERKERMPPESTR